MEFLSKPYDKYLTAKKEEIDSKKYMEFMESTLEQITSSMDLDFDTILGKPKQTGLDEFFWNQCKTWKLMEHYLQYLE